MSQITGLEFKLQEMAGRIRTLREIAEFTPAQMAEKTGISVETYIRCEQGKEDLNFAFLYRCALALGVDVTDIIEGASPKLSTYMVTRKGEGQHIEQAHGLTYYNLAARFKNRIANPLYVRAEYSEAAQYSDIQLTTHYGQECDIVIEGRLKVQVGEHIEILEEGDSIYYDSSTPHGMIAMDGKDCLFYAIVLSPDGETQSEPAQYLDAPVAQAENQSRIYENFIIPHEQDGALQAIDFKNEDSFNFAYDIVDVLAETKPDKLAMLHLDVNKTERRFTSRISARTLPVQQTTLSRWASRRAIALCWYSSDTISSGLRYWACINWGQSPFLRPISCSRKTSLTVLRQPASVRFCARQTAILQNR